MMTMTMEAAMAEHPETVVLLLRNRIHCVGCALAPFHTVAEAAFEHHMDDAALLTLLATGHLRPRPDL
jgi:hybrid cluster-associated redox disulfide protein